MEHIFLLHKYNMCVCVGGELSEGVLSHYIL